MAEKYGVCASGTTCMSDLADFCEQKVTTTEMHTGGEPLRVIESGYPEIIGSTLLEKRKYCKEKLDHLRSFLMYEPRGHYDMYGAILVLPDLPEADIAVLFIHNEGYSTMCGHAVIALGRYLIDKGLIKAPPVSPETTVNIQCPCGLVTAFVQYNNGITGKVRFHSVPSFAFALDVEVFVEGLGTVKVDVSFGGAFYALVPAERLNLSLETDSVQDIARAATKVSEAVRKNVTLLHPGADCADLCFLYGTIVTDGKDELQDEPTFNCCVFADSQVDRSPCGSGVSARMAVQYRRRLISANQTRSFKSSVTGSLFTGKVHRAIKGGIYDGAVVVEVAGNAFYTGSSVFTCEENDALGQGFLAK